MIELIFQNIQGFWGRIFFIHQIFLAFFTKRVCEIQLSIHISFFEKNPIIVTERLGISWNIFFQKSQTFGKSNKNKKNSTYTLQNHAAGRGSRKDHWKVGDSPYMETPPYIRTTTICWKPLWFYVLSQVGDTDPFPTPTFWGGGSSDCPCRPRAPQRLVVRVRVRVIGQAWGWSGRTCKVEIDETHVLHKALFRAGRSCAQNSGSRFRSTDGGAGETTPSAPSTRSFLPCT